jgi:hypothetical protein
LELSEQQTGRQVGLSGIATLLNIYSNSLHRLVN